METLGQANINSPFVVVLRHDGFSVILVFIKNLQNASIKNVVQSSRNLAQMIYR